MSDRPSSVVYKFVLYSHYAAHEADDWKAYQDGSTQPKDLDGLRHLEEHFRGLRELLSTPGHEGLLVLFFAPGYADFLHGIKQGKRAALLRTDSRKLSFADEVTKCARQKLAEAHLADRVRFVTSLDLDVILGRAHAISKEDFPLYLMGDAETPYYDAPKIPEAILRLRAVGNGVPVLRVDHDVIFRGKLNKAQPNLGLLPAVVSALKAYHLRLEEPDVSTFLFSASYNDEALIARTGERGDPFTAWSQAFATRVYPALIADCRAMQAVYAKSSEKDRKSAWRNYVRKHLNEGLARQYYGLASGRSTLEVDTTGALTSIGAHPLFAVISGAFLCLSDGAILDLPPFSNFHNNVMWIDDHLKYSLHRAMHHFTSGDTLVLREKDLSDARLDKVKVTKGRPDVNELPVYVFGSYLPTLLWGAIMDAWINTDPILKYRAAGLEGNDLARWRAAINSQHDAPLPRSMLEALRVGHFAEQKELRARLEESAVQRIEQVRQVWAKLCMDATRGKRGTFASYWAEGKVESTFPPEWFAKCRNTLWQGISHRPIGKPVTSVEHLTQAVMRKVLELIDDAVAYINWTIAWPRFVQIVRSIRPGTFIGDLTWRGHEAERS